MFRANCKRLQSPLPGYPPEIKRDLLAGGLTEADLAKRGIAEDPLGENLRLFFQQVPESKVVKNRVQ
ncbi:MAG: hypothetical protein M3116_06860, partial [Actinomycetota bacterium]|nr:hypothetical protein [Actinomycetota bacterium]